MPWGESRIRQLVYHPYRSIEGVRMCGGDAFSPGCSVGFDFTPEIPLARYLTSSIRCACV